MKIALIRQKYTPFGGAERYMSRLVAGLAAEGHEVHILAVSWDGPRTDGVIFHPVQVFRKPGWLKALSFSNGCSRIIEHEKFDIVFSLERTLRQDIYRAGDGCHRQWLILKNQGKGFLPKVLTWLNPLQLIYIWLERRMFTAPALKAIIANSETGKQDIIRLYGVSPEKIHVVYNGIDPVHGGAVKRQLFRDELATEFSLGDELRLLYVGSGFKRKGVATAIRAAARLSIPFRLFIVGKGKSGCYVSLAQKLGIDGSIVFTGPRRDVELFYGGSDLFVFPTLYDPFSNATLEAMAYGLPTITSKYNGVAELINHEVNGYVVEDPLDDTVVAECINLLSDPVHRRDIGKRAAKTAAAFTMQRNIKETLDVINGVSTSLIS